MATNWKKLYAMKEQARKRLKDVVPFDDERTGIYILLRDDESGLKFAYVGQAVKIRERLISHLLGYSQRIDISLKKRGFYDYYKRPYGWQLLVDYCGEDELDELEQFWIREYASKGYQLYNKTTGGQGEGKAGIDGGQSPKGYRDGLKQGYKNALGDVKEYFDKYLVYMSRRDPECFKKDGSMKEIYIKKFAEFTDLLEGKE